MRNDKTNRLFKTTLDKMCNNQRNDMLNPVDMFCCSYELKHFGERVPRVDVDYPSNMNVPRYTKD